MRQNRHEKGRVFAESTGRIYRRIQNPSPKCLGGNEERFSQTWVE